MNQNCRLFRFLDLYDLNFVFSCLCMPMSSVCCVEVSRRVDHSAHITLLFAAGRWVFIWEALHDFRDIKSDLRCAGERAG